MRICCLWRAYGAPKAPQRRAKAREGTACRKGAAKAPQIPAKPSRNWRYPAISFYLVLSRVDLTKEPSRLGLPVVSPSRSAHPHIADALPASSASAVPRPRREDAARPGTAHAPSSAIRHDGSWHAVRLEPQPARRRVSPPLTPRGPARSGLGDHLQPATPPRRKRSRPSQSWLRSCAARGARPPRQGAAPPSRRGPRGVEAKLACGKSGRGRHLHVLV